MPIKQTFNPSLTSDATDIDRSQRRLHRAGLTGVATLLARGMTMVIGLVTLPLTAHYLGKERFGLWLTLSSFIAWVGVADLGLSNSLINALATADGSDDRKRAREAIASAFWITSLVALLLIAVGLIVLPLISWPGIFNVTAAETAHEIAPTVIVILIFSALRLPASIVGCVYHGYQEGYVYQLWNGLSGLLGALGLIAAIKLKAGLPWLALAFLASMLLADLLSAIYLFGWRREWLLPRWRYFRWPQSRQLLRQGGQFWIAGTSSVLMLQMDLFLVSIIFGAGAVAGFGTTMRLFALIGAAQLAFVAPLWAAYSEAAARRDFHWLAQTFNRSIKISLLWSLPAAIAMFIAMPWLFKLLLPADVTADWHLRLAVMTTEILNSVARCVSTLLNGLGAVRSQAILGPLGGAVNLLLSWLLAQWLGVPGVAWATALCLLSFWLVVMGNEARLRLRALNSEVAYAG